MTAELNIDVLLIHFCLNKWPPQAQNGCCRKRVLLCRERYLFISCQEMESLSERVNEMSDWKSASMGENWEDGRRGTMRACSTDDYMYCILYIQVCYALCLASALTAAVTTILQRVHEHTQDICIHVIIALLLQVQEGRQKWHFSSKDVPYIFNLLYSALVLCKDTRDPLKGTLSKQKKSGSCYLNTR